MFKSTKSAFSHLFQDVFCNHPKDLNHLKQLLQNAKNRQILDHDSFYMIEGALQISNMHARDVMIPRSQMTTLDGQATPEEVLPIIIETAHSRFPVVGENGEEIMGILLAKDLLKVISIERNKPVHIQELIRPATFVPESKRLDILLKEFRINRNHMAIVIDEYGGVAGLVTIEDVLEQIVGEIEDEYDLEEEPPIKKINDNEFLVKAITPIEEFNDYFHTDYKRDDFDTVGGLALQKFDHLPKRGESITFDQFKVVVAQANERGILLLRIRKLKTL